MNNNQYRKPVLTSTEEFVTSQGVFKRIITLYRRILTVNGSIVLDDYSLLEDEFFLDALKSKFMQEDFKGHIDFNDNMVPFDINLDVSDEDEAKVEFFKLGTHTLSFIFKRLTEAPKSCNFKFNDYGREHKYVLNNITYDHTVDIEAAIGKEKTEQLKAELNNLAIMFDSYNYD